MKTPRVLALLAGVAALAGCLENSPLEPVCQPITSQRDTVRGDTVLLRSGLRILPGAPGAGAPVESCQQVELHFDLFAQDTLRVSSRDSAAIRFRPGDRTVVRGLEEGVLGMRPGGTRRLIVPPGLGYGGTARLGPTREVIIPANSTLVIDVELVAVEP